MSEQGERPSTDQPVPVAELSYTAASRELDDIVAFFEQREVDVDLLVSRLERATAIVDELDRRIRQTRMQVEQLVPRLEAATVAVEEDFEEEVLEAWDEVGERHSDSADALGNTTDSEQPLF